MTQLQQVQQPKQKETVLEESREKTSIDATISNISDEGITVDVTKDMLRAEATLIHENGEEKKVMDFSEDTETKTHTLSLEDTAYEQFKASPWEVLQTQFDDQVTVTPVQRSAWDFVQHLRLGHPQLTAVQHDIIPHITQPQSANEQTHHISTTRPEAVFRRETASTPIHDTVDYEAVTLTTYEVDEFVPDTSVPADVASEPVGYTDTAIATETLLEPGTQPLQHDQEQAHHDVLSLGTYEDGDVEARLTYQVSETVEEGTTVKDTLLDLVEQGDLDATIVKQPFYSPESFENADGEEIDAGWQDGFYGVVQMEDMPMDMTEFSYGDDPDNMQLAMDDIDSIELDGGEYIDFESSEAYTCGVAEEQDAHRDAWESAYGEFDRFGSVTERGVYAAMMDGRTFEGAPLDLSLFEDARDAYIENAGLLPEETLDNVVYTAS